MSQSFLTDPTITENLLNWYDKNHRQLPWRAPLGQQGNPYAVWISEIMLQQTTVPTVKSYFEKFMLRWPTLDSFAAADLEDVLHMWQGLGYYSRARNLHKCAQVLTHNHSSIMPSDEKTLLSLPGVGPYTAAAIRSIAFNKYAVVVDGNVERVVSRLFDIQEPLPTSKPVIKEYMAGLTCAKRPGDFAQSMMDLGSMICTPKSPKCSLCPLQSGCKSYENGGQEELPRKLPKKEKPTRYGWSLWAVNAKGEILLRKRPDKGLLAKMTEIPSSHWCESNEKPDDFLNGFGVQMPKGKVLEGEVKHTFTHFHLRIKVVVFHNLQQVGNGRWVHPSCFHEHALPTVMKKVIDHAMQQKEVWQQGQSCVDDAA